MTNHPSDDTQFSGTEVAIIGMAGHFPGANDLATFWQNLRDGRETLSRLSDEELLAAGVSPEELRDPNYVRVAPTLEGVDLFDAGFFGFTPTEAEITDPQQRIFMECVWESLEHAGYNPETYPQSIGVFAGSRTNTYVFNLVSDPQRFKALGVFQISIGNDLASLATRVSYKLNLKGPSYAVHTACSTALVAVHLACQSLLIDECQIAIAGGVAVNVPHKVGYLYEPGSVLSPDGHCRPFDAAAGGTIFGSGAGAVVLKRLEDALADGDTIHAIIKGSATNNDGAVKATFTAPSVDGQAEVIMDALAEAEVSPDTISYVEAHGTGTALGDPIELRALTKAFRSGTQRTGFCAIGSVKSNLGHLDAAAGMSSLIKTVLALQHQQLPPSLHYRQPNPRIDFENSPFVVNTTLRPWASDGPRRAGVSSFGFGGTNAHVVLEEAPPRSPSAPGAPWQLLVLSARSPAALEQQTARLAAHLAQQPQQQLADVAFTLQVGRKAFPHRRVLVCSSQDEALAALRGSDPQQLISGHAVASDRPVVFLFPGQGAQYPGMARDLYASEPVFRAALDECASLLRPHLDIALRELLFADTPEAGERLQQTQYAQPALFAVEYALAQLWLHWGVQPQALAGHSLGEYVAATLAGVFPLADALALVAARGQLMQQQPPGAMLSVPLPEADVLPLLGDQLDLAAVNSPRQCVVSGPAAAVAALEQQLRAQGVTVRRLHTSHAFHSAMLDPVVAAFEARVRTVTLQPPSRPVVSNVTGSWLTAEQATDPRYWARQLRAPVRFADGLALLGQEPARVLLEVGPGTTLSSLARQQPEPLTTSATLRHPNDQRHDQAVLLGSLGRLWANGVAIDWAQLHSAAPRQRVPLPTYPFERQRYWIEAKQLPTAAAPTPTTVLEKRPDLNTWFYQPVWRPAPLPPRVAESAEHAASWLIFGDAGGLGAALAARLTAAQHVVVRVQAGSGLARIANDLYTIDPRASADYIGLLEQLRSQGMLPSQLVHLWSLDDAGLEATPAAVLDQGFYSLLYLAQALGRQNRADRQQITVVASQSQRVAATEPLLPERATLFGPVQVIPKEYPNIGCRSIDIAPVTDAAACERLAEQLLAELGAPATTAPVAYRGAERLIQAIEPLQLAEQASPPIALRPGGVYLITGGLGGIGLALAEHLARVAQARLVLLGRSQLPPREQWETLLASGPADRAGGQIRQILALEELGAEVLVASADVTDRVQMAAVLDQTLARFGVLHGVIHAAGVAGGGVIQLKTAEMAARVLAPKLQGTRVIYELTRGLGLDVVVLCSSVESVLGDIGQVDYCAANAFLDSFAQRYSQPGATPLIALGWDDWQEVGIAVNTEVPAELRAWRAELLKQGITNSEGVAVFGQVLAHPLAHVIVSTRDLPTRISEGAAAERRDLLPDFARGTAAGAPSGSNLSRAALERRIAAIWQRVLGVPQVGLHDNFFDLGGNSISGMLLLGELKLELNIQVTPVALFEAPTISALASLIQPNPGMDDDAPAAATSASGPVAIIGMAGRFPGADDVDAFWQNLRNGVESITSFSEQELRAAGVPAALLEDPRYVRARPLLQGVADFDAGLFGYSPREAELMDPQHRLFLECTWQALELAGYAPTSYAGPIGVFAGANLSSYLLNLFSNTELIQSIDPMLPLIGNAQDSFTTSVSYKLNLTGPSMAVQTFCSTALVAVHLACQSLRRGECEIALAGGAAISVPQESGYLYQEDGILSPDGHCRTFDARAAGTLFGNGVGVVVLKPLERALRDGDTIYAVVKGSAINNDGALKVGYTAPSVQGQALVISAALADAGVAADSIGYVEAHGTGTALGDPIEVAALTRAFQARDQRQFCAIGSVKPNIGHLDRAAGAAALIKTVLALHHGELPPSLHYESPNPSIDFASTPFYVNTKLRPWPRSEQPRRAGVSALGFGGTNAHLIVEEAPLLAPSSPALPWQLLTLSARTASALEQATAQLASYLANHPEVNLADLAWTLQVGRTAMAQRRVVVARDPADALAALAAPERAPAATAGAQPPAVVFLFPGQGAQYASMGQDLYASEPVFRSALDECARLLHPHLTIDLRELLFAHSDPSAQPDAPPATDKPPILTQTEYAQPALFALEYALAQLLISWGVQPQAMLGHSVGEYVAATLAGVFTLADALALVAARGRLMQALPAGAMLAVELPEAEVVELLPPELSLAAVNSPNQCVVAGPLAAIERYASLLEARAVNHRRLHSSHAFHSAMVEPALPAFEAQLRQIQLNPPQLPLVSNVTGDWLSDAQATDPAYWAGQMRAAVRFADGVARLSSDESAILVEVGPGTALSSFARRHSPPPATVATMRHPRDQRAERAVLLAALGQLWLAGLPLRWDALHSERRRRIALPTYPFERQRYWLDAGTPLAPGRATRASGGGVARWLGLPSWKRTPLPTPFHAATVAEQRQTWLLLDDRSPLGQALAEQLSSAGQLVVLVQPGETFGQPQPGAYRLRPTQPEDYRALLDELASGNPQATRIVDLWGLTAASAAAPAWRSHSAALLTLLQTLGQHGRSAVQLWLVTHNLHDISGDEGSNAAHAALLGLCRTAAQEYPHLTCRTIDLALPTANPTRLRDQLLAELIADAPEASVAYRGAHRWTPIVEQAPAGTAGAGRRLKPQGAYLVTGELAGPALHAASYLAESLQARLALLAPTPWPARAEWPLWQAEEDHGPLIERLAAQITAQQRLPVDLAASQAELRQIEQRIADTVPLAHAPPELAAATGRLGAALICAYMRDHGIDTRAGATATREAIRAQLGIQPAFARLYAHMLATLQEHGAVTLDGDRVIWRHDLLADQVPATLRAELEQRFPQSRDGLRFLEHCVGHYGQVLTGALDAVSVLYPHGSSDMVRAVEQSQEQFSNRRRCRAALVQTVQRLAQQAGRRLRILEVGGGDADLTRELLVALRDHPVDYLFTDISKGFVNAARRQASQHPSGLRCAVLDIARDPVAQGLVPASFDIIIAAEVVHATGDIRATLDQLERLLVPSGLLLLIEATRAQPWAGLVWGLLDGWWSFTDHGLRQESPLLPGQTWTTLLEQRVPAALYRYPQPTDGQPEADYALLVVQQPHELRTPEQRALVQAAAQASRAELGRRIAWVQDLERQGAEVLLAAAPPDNPAALRQAITGLQEQLGRLHGALYQAPALPEAALATLDLAGDTPIDGAARGMRALAEALDASQLDWALAVTTLAPLLGGPGQSLAAASGGQLGATIAAGQLPGWTWVGWEQSSQHAAPDRQLWEQLFALDTARQIVVAAGPLAEGWQIARPPSAPAAAPARLHPRPNLTTPYQAPRDATEQAIAAIWQQILGIAEIGVYDSFLDLGGDSLQATQLMTRIRDGLGVNLPMSVFFEAPTISGLAQASAAALAVADDSELDDILSLVQDMSADDIAAELERLTQAYSGDND